jgi:hypothetical protein
MRRVVLALLLLAPALAGCLGGEAPLSPPADDETSGEGSLASLDVTVLDPGRVPFPDLTVTLITSATTRTATSNVLGIARFTDVPPGNVTVRVEAPGHLPAERALTLAPGQTGTIEVQMQRAGPVTWVEELEFEGFFECAATYLIITGDCFVLLDALGAPDAVNPTNEDYVYVFSVRPGWTLLRITQSWDEPEFSLGSMMRVNLESTDEDSIEHNERYGRAEGETPIVLEILPGVRHETASNDEMVLPPEGGEVRTRSFHLGLKDLHNAGDQGFLGVGVAYQQRFRVDIEIHYEA